MFSKLILWVKLTGVICTYMLTRLKSALTARIHRLTYRTVPDGGSSDDQVRNIVIVGASFAGYYAALSLAKLVPTGYRIVVIEKHSHFQFTWVFPRFSAVKGHEHKALIPYGPLLAGVAPAGSYQWVRGRVEKIKIGEEQTENHQQKEKKEKNSVVVRQEEENGQMKMTRIAFDYLVMATGATADAGLPSRLGVDDKKDSIQAFRDLQDRILSASDIVVLGGGPAGVELAADVKEQYPEKNVTLVHSRDALLNQFGPKMQEIAMKELQQLGVQIILGERLQQQQQQQQSPQEREGYVVLKSGKQIACDCFIKCVGQKPNSNLIANISPPSISESGHIRVRPTLQIANPEYDNIYAIGDVAEIEAIDGTTTTTNKNARSAVEQAEIVAQNIVHNIKGRKQILYRPKWWERLTKVTLGLTKSVAWVSDGKAEIIISSASKDVTMDSARVWQMFGVKPFDDPDDKQTVETVAATV